MSGQESWEWVVTFPDDHDYTETISAWNVKVNDGHLAFFNKEGINFLTIAKGNWYSVLRSDHKENVR